MCFEPRRQPTTTFEPKVKSNIAFFDSSPFSDAEPLELPPLMNEEGQPDVTMEIILIGGSGPMPDFSSLFGALELGPMDALSLAQFAEVESTPEPEPGTAGYFAKLFAQMPAGATVFFGSGYSAPRIVDAVLQKSNVCGTLQGAEFVNLITE